MVPASANILSFLHCNGFHTAVCTAVAGSLNAINFKDGRSLDENNLHPQYLFARFSMFFTLFSTRQDCNTMTFSHPCK
jgi:hypothetical protein